MTDTTLLLFSRADASRYCLFDRGFSKPKSRFEGEALLKALTKWICNKTEGNNHFHLFTNRSKVMIYLF